MKGYGYQVKPEAPPAHRPQGERLQGVLLRVLIQKGGGLSPGVQWNHWIASAGSERRVDSPAGGEVCLYAKLLLSLVVDFYYTTIKGH